jgi:hypothetical protein
VLDAKATAKTMSTKQCRGETTDVGSEQQVNCREGISVNKAIHREQWGELIATPCKGEHGQSGSMPDGYSTGTLRHPVIVKLHGAPART